MTTPIAGIMDLQERLVQLAPKLTPQPMPKVALTTSKHGVKTSSSVRGLDLLLAHCVTEEQQEKVIELAAKYNPSDLEIAFNGSFNDKTKQFNLTKAVFLNEQQMLVHNFVELLELQLEEPENAATALRLLLTENNRKASDLSTAEECISIAYALQTLLRAFPSIPLAVQNETILVDEETDVVKLFSPLFVSTKSPKPSKKQSQGESLKKRKSRV